LPVPDPYGAERAPSQPSAQRSRAGISPATRKPAQTAEAPAAAAVRAPPKQIVDELEAPIETVSLDRAAAAGAGLAAGLAATNRATASVAVAIEFGRAGGGWAGAIVFNIWLRRQLRERRMSQRRLAALSGVDHSTISRLLREDRRPSLTTATKLVGALRHVRGEQAESDTADYFERTPEETVFPARRVELALRADEELDDDQVRRLMSIYLNARRRHQETASRPAAPARAGPARAGAARAVPDRS
jgi:transcriptional regulator with XRE-family HTH domain